MKIIVSGSDLSSAVLKVSKAISVRTTNPVLEGIKMSVRGDDLTLTATDMEIAIEKTVRCETFMEGDTVVPGKMFAELVKKLENENEVEIYLQEENRLKIVYGENEMYMSTLSSDEFPSIKKNLREKYFTVTQKEYKNLIDKTVFCCSTDESRPILKGCLFEVKGDTLKCVAIDGFRMALATQKLKTASGDFKIIVPARALAEISRLLENDEADLTLLSEDNSVMMENEGVTFVSRLLEGEFINYEQIIPKEYKTTVQVERESLLNSLERAAIVAKEARNVVKLDIKDRCINIKANSERGNVNENVFVTMEGKDIEINFNSKYLCEALKAADEDFVVIRFVGEIAPATITPYEGDGYLYLVLPIRINS